MDFKQLEAFVTAVNEGSFSNAADRLQLSQSMVTIHIRNLERELGARLLNRTTRSMELTDQGRTFYSYAREMLTLNRDSVLALSRSVRDENAVEIVATRFIVRYYLLDLVIDFNRRHPEINLRFQTAANSEIYDRLEADGSSLAFCNMKPMNSEYAMRHCGDTRPVVVTPNDERYRALTGQPFPLSVFKEAPVITRSGTSPLQQAFMRWKKMYIPDTKLKVVAAIDDTETIKRMVAAGMGITVLSEVAVREMVREGRVLCFPLEGAMPYHLYFVYKKRFLSPESALFRDHILEHLAQSGGAEDRPDINYKGVFP